MKAFNNGAELRLTREDMAEIIGHTLNDKLLGICMEKHYIESLTFHPKCKYIARVTIAPVSKRVSHEQD